MQIAKWLRECKLTYAVPREFPEPWPFFTPIVYAIATIIFVLLAFLNAALVGYETVAVLHPDFNITQSFWFDRFRPGGFGLSKPGTLCDPMTINPGDRFTTNYSLFEWDLVTVGGPKAGKSLIYKGSPLQSCDGCAQYIDARVQEHSADLTTLICCEDVDGFSVLAKTSFSLTTVGGLNTAPPVLGAIPDHVKYMMAESSRSMLLNTMLQYANDDFAKQLNGMLLVDLNTSYPVIISMYIFSHPCPASNQTCAKMPFVEDQALTVIYSDATSMVFGSVYQSAAQFAASAPPIKRITASPYPAISNLAHTIFASVQIDLGNPSPSNFLLNRSMVDDTIFNKIDSIDTFNSFFYSRLYNASITAPPLTLEGPAVIQALYSCRLQLAKPIGSAVISVMVATLSMFMSGWAMFIFFSSQYAERKRESELGGQVNRKGPYGYRYQASTKVIGDSESERVTITDDASSDGGGVEDLETR